MAPTMRFATKIVALQHREWSHYYLDYNGLKRILAENDGGCSDGNGTVTIQHQEEDGLDVSTISLLSYTLLQNVVVTSKRFLQVLYMEVQKICLFSLKEQGKIATELDTCNNQQEDIAMTVRSMDDDDDNERTRVVRSPISDGEDPFTAE